jgi:hypothetical protein
MKEFKEMLIDLMLLDEDNAMEMLRQFADRKDLNENDKLYKQILKYIKEYER